MHQADKVILHSLVDISIVKLLFLSPWLLKKCYWVIWGNDLYTYKFDKRNRRWRVREVYRRPVIKKMGYLVTYMQGDINLAREWYGAQGEYKECLMYTSNIYKSVEIKKSANSQVSIQLGNSANSTNNHIEIIEKLARFEDNNFRVYTPLSYSDQNHAKKLLK
ncbi:TDP-N-acetylfucosamine:lipid II N-acetylfucosaminyltransferase [Psychrobacter sp. ER1]|uniref:TDP-N-acetylfucosamine:lipid II N-acetylfucosaminyltransferase n=1 Tax=Psychrobacter sp. ER1 TaxID=3406645 RepID=UPI003B430981